MYDRNNVTPIQSKPKQIKSNPFSEAIVRKEPIVVKFESIKSREKVDHWQYKVYIERKYIDFPFRADSMEPLPIYYYNPKTYPSLAGKKESSLKNDRKSNLDSSEMNEHALKMGEKYQTLESRVFDYFGYEDLIPMCGFSLHRDLAACTKVVKEERIIYKFIDVVGEVYDGKEAESERGEAPEKTIASKLKEKKEIIIKKEAMDIKRSRFVGDSESSSNIPFSLKEDRNPYEFGESVSTKSRHSEPGSLQPFHSAESVSSALSNPHQSLSHSTESPSTPPSTPPQFSVEPRLPKSPTMKPAYNTLLYPPYPCLSMPPTSCFPPFSMLGVNDSNLYNVPPSLLSTSCFHFFYVPPSASMQGQVHPFLASSPASSMQSPAMIPSVPSMADNGQRMGEMRKPGEMKRGGSEPMNPSNSLNSMNPSNSLNSLNSMNPSNSLNSLNSMNPSNSLNNSSKSIKALRESPSTPSPYGAASKNAVGNPERKKGQFCLYFPSRPSLRDSIQRLQTHLRVGMFRRRDLPPVFTPPPIEPVQSAVATQREANVDSLYSTLVSRDDSMASMASIVNIPPIYRDFTKKQLPKIK